MYRRRARWIDPVFIGTIHGVLAPDPNEISALLWVAVDELAADMKENPDHYTVWLPNVVALVA